MCVAPAIIFGVVMEKRYMHFNYAFEHWTGKKWEWKINGEQNHPMDSEDPTVRAFYTGFILARKGQKFLQDKMKELKNVELKLNQIKRDIAKYSKPTG